MCKAPTEEADVHAALLCRAALKIVILLAQSQPQVLTLSQVFSWWIW